MDVAVVIATYGERSWIERARRAKISAEAEGPADLVVFHGSGTLAQARNDAAASSSGEWLCFLDADDELEPGYLAAMAEAEPLAGLLAPAVRYVEPDHVPEPIVLDDRNIATLNPCVIGTLIRRERFDQVGGFWNERAYEDWSLFRRAHLAGDPVIHVRSAVYRAHVNPAGRNNVTGGRALIRQITASTNRWHRQRKARR